MWAALIWFGAGGVTGSCAHGKGTASSFLNIAATQDGLPAME